MICAQWRVSWISKRSLTAMMSQRISRIFLLWLFTIEIICFVARASYFIFFRISEATSKAHQKIRCNFVKSKVFTELKMGKWVHFHPSTCTIICCCIAIAAISNCFMTWWQLLILLKSRSFSNKLWFVLNMSQASVLARYWAMDTAVSIDVESINYGFRANFSPIVFWALQLTTVEWKLKFTKCWWLKQVCAVFGSP